MPVNDTLQNLPVQKQLRESYQKLVFSPIGTIIARKRPRKRDPDSQRELGFL
ncbi:MAG: hypothetical protein ACFE9L_12465 [Candidatus Hodarchaeota archaeon]